MEEDWETYCLMAGIALIEEISKPYPHKQIKNNLEYECFASMQLKCISKDIIYKWFSITKLWERKLKTNFIGSTFKNIKLDKYGKWYFGLSPNWIYYIIKTTGKLPSSYTNKSIIYRLKNWRLSNAKSKEAKYILSKKTFDKLLNKKSIYSLLLNNKELSAGAFIISFDFEFRGITTGNPSLCMSETYKDFLEFMLKIANKRGWATLDHLSNIDVSYSRNLGINATDQYDFRIKKTKIKEIYDLAGPLADGFKEKCIKHHIKRALVFKDYRAVGVSRNKIYNALKKLKKSTTTELQFYTTVGHDIILRHLHKLEKDGLITKNRLGKKYYWEIKNASQCNY